MALTFSMQGEASECGLACLSTVLKHFGYQNEMAELRQQWPVSDRGLSLQSLITIARDYNLDARAVRVDIEGLRKLPKATILHWRENHFVVFISCKFNRYNIIDPALGKLSLSAAEITRQFTGIALELFPSRSFKIRRYKPEPLALQLLKQIPAIYSSLANLLVFSLALEIIGLIFPMLTQVVVDEVVMTRDIDLMKGVVIAIVGLSTCHFGLSLARGDLSIRFRQSSAHHMKVQVLRHLTDLPADWFLRRHVGDIQSRFLSISNIQNGVTSASTQNVLDGIMAIFTAVMVVVYGGWIGIVACLSVIADILLKTFLYAKYKSATVSAASLDGQQQSIFLETVRAISTIKMIGLTQTRVLSWANKNVELSNVRSTQQKTEMLAGRLQELASGIDRGIVLYLGGLAVLNGAMTIGTLVAFLAYKDQTDRRISSLTGALLSLRSLSVQTERLRDIIGERKETEGNSQYAPRNHEFGASYPSVILKSVSKRYQSATQWLFNGVTLQIEPGSRVLINGPSGCGKTTLLKIIIGLIQPDDGAVISGGILLSSSNIKKYRSLYSGVLQDDNLLSGNLIQNISCFQLDPDLRKVERCARTALIMDDIEKLPMGLLTQVSSNGSNFSGGQRQRILIARTLYLNAPLIFFDEATNQLDAESEQRIMQSLVETGKTLIFITHRETLSGYATIRLTFRDGKIVRTDARETND